MTLWRAAAAEAIGTALLLAIVVGSGIMGERLAQDNAAVALLANSIATGAGLYALIVILGPISGAHFNPVVSAVSVWDRRMSGRCGDVYMLAQISGAFAGVAAAHAMFSLPIIQISARVRPTLGEGLGEVIATFGLVLGDRACCEISRRGDSHSRCSFHYERLLVYFLNIFCQSRRDHRAGDDRYLRGNLAAERAAFCRRSVAWRCRRDVVCALASGWNACKYSDYKVMSNLEPGFHRWALSIWRRIGQ